MALCILISYCQAHFIAAPNLFGRKSINGLKQRGFDLRSRRSDYVDPNIKSDPIFMSIRRGNTNEQCGPTFGSCDAGYCCSAAYDHLNYFCIFADIV
jgi:hypothetical protein